MKQSFHGYWRSKSRAIKAKIMTYLSDNQSFTPPPRKYRAKPRYLGSEFPKPGASTSHTSEFFRSKGLPPKGMPLAWERNPLDKPQRAQRGTKSLHSQARARSRSSSKYPPLVKKFSKGPKDSLGSDSETFRSKGFPGKGIPSPKGCLWHGATHKQINKF